MAMAHTAHAVETASARLGAWTMAGPSHRARVACADMSGTLAMNAAAFAVHGLSILRVQCRLA